MNYQKCTLELLLKLGIKPAYKGCTYIISGISYIHTQGKYIIPDSEMVHTHIATQYRLAPVAIENSIRNVIQRIWQEKTNPDLMHKIFGKHNLTKRPCNIEFLMLIYNYMKYHMNCENSEKQFDKP